MSQKQNQEPHPETLKGMIDYQKESVVSRTLIKGEHSNVTLFAFSKGQELSEHTAPFDAMAYVLDGKAEVIISGESHTLADGEMIIMPANEPHAVKAPTDFKMLLIMIK